ncbi:MAG: hypothetical protein M3Y33_19825, partial [Actinomycetota bacterium]|nr:hypothetical protein [Actinomycetota bacterium]
PGQGGGTARGKRRRADPGSAEDHQRGGEIFTVMAAGGGVVCGHLGQHGYFPSRPREQWYYRERLSQGPGHGQGELMMAAKVGALMGEDCLKLTRAEQGQRRRGHHYTVAPERQAVGRGRVEVEDSRSRHPVRVSSGGQEGGMHTLLVPGWMPPRQNQPSHRYPAA